MGSRSPIGVVVREIGRILAEYGFAADGREFRRRSSLGDWVVVDVQTSDASSRSRSLFFVNAGFTMGVRWDRDRSVMKRERVAPAVTNCLWRTRIDPRHGDGSKRWVIDSEVTVEAVVSELEQVLHQRIPNLVRLLDRSHLQNIADQEAGLGYATWQVKAWLLAEEGRTGELEAFFSPLQTMTTEPRTRRIPSSRLCGSWQHQAGSTPTVSDDGQDRWV
ncbi:DUF4304 domain-containing protein [Micromonospora echinaurantiaca]|uniref:DUF4304 domain-containing protein n=1 Tax=Micromonospora echinaurantiaca TaxID=47857 RepID=UPI0037ADAE2E